MRGLVLFTVGLLLAGCAAPLQGETAPTSSAPPEPVLYDGLLLSDCTRTRGLFPLPKEQAQELLPPDYTAGDLLDDSANTPLGAITMELVDCAGLDGIRTVLVYVGVWVEPPALVAKPSSGYAVFLLGSVHAQEDTSALFARWNLTPVESAPLDPSALEAAGVSRTTLAAGGVELSTVTASSSAGTDVGLPVRFYSVVGGKTAGFVDLRATGPGTGQQGTATLVGSTFLGHSLPPLGPGIGATVKVGGLTLGYEPIEWDEAGTSPLPLVS